MGKSPAKWIKTVLFGKKTSKSNSVKGKEKSTNEKEVRVRVNTPETGQVENLSVVSTGLTNIVDTEARNLVSGNREASVGQLDEGIPGSANQICDVKQTVKLDVPTDAERNRQETAATKAQAAFRGYLARRAFKALRGIIRLQALIRGHLVRRQAVSTLYCIIGIVKLQALVRGSRIRCSNTGQEVRKVCVLVTPQDGKLRDPVAVDMSTRIAISSGNPFVRKILAPLPKMMSLQVQYDSMDPNSVLNWLERWSLSQPWKTVPPPEKVSNQRVLKKQGNPQTVEAESSRPKRSVRKSPTSADNTSLQAAAEFERPRRNLKKVVNNAGEMIQENPQSELEKVKRNLRKVRSPVIESSVQPEAVNEKPSQNQGKALSSIAQHVPGPSEMIIAEKVKEESTFSVMEGFKAVSEPADVASPLEPIQMNETVELSNVEPAESDRKDENIPLQYEESKSKEDLPLGEPQKSGRRASFPAKQDPLEDGLENTPKLPSYMASTESAKAKLRGHGSPRFSQDGGERNNLTRRHSLPSSANGKVSSASPRTQKPSQASGKGGNRSDRSMLSSRDGNGKVVQAEWRR
ncbi:IQ-domain [Ancistrocladus abbreviatus]